MLIDTHAHLDQDDFAADRDDVIARARAVGVETIVCVGVSAASSAAAVQLAANYCLDRPEMTGATGVSPVPAAQHWRDASGTQHINRAQSGHYGVVLAAIGIHPNSCAEASPTDWDRIVALADQPRVVALGETGLDRYWDHAPLALQQDYFQRHLDLSRRTGLPVIIHCRDAADDLMPMLRAEAVLGPLRGVLHAFSGDALMAAECVALGLYISFAGNVTYPNKKFAALREAARTAPADRLLVETDSPYLMPQIFRGKQRRNEPAHVLHTAQFLAELRGVSAADFAAQTTANARRLFGRP